MIRVICGRCGGTGKLSRSIDGKCIPKCKGGYVLAEKPFALVNHRGELMQSFDTKEQATRGKAVFLRGTTGDTRRRLDNHLRIVDEYDASAL